MADDINYEWLYGMAKVISEGVSLLLGFVCVFLVGYITIITALDVVYIAVPTSRGLGQAFQQKFDGTPLGGIRFTSQDAVKAVEKAYIDGTNPMWEYLKKRLVSYFIFASALYMMVTGANDLRTIISGIVIDILSILGFLA